jgi:hypothetical protein
VPHGFRGYRATSDDGESAPTSGRADATYVAVPQLSAATKAAKNPAHLRVRMSAKIVAALRDWRKARELSHQTSILFLPVGLVDSVTLD